MNKLLALVLMGTFCGTGRAAGYPVNETVITGARSIGAVSNRNPLPGLPRRSALSASPAINSYLVWLSLVSEYVFSWQDISRNPGGLFSSNGVDFGGYISANLGTLMGGGGGAGNSDGDE
ncbi:MAG: hypothetical protein WCW52_09080 [Elusimicrobiales bacterium]